MKSPISIENLQASILEIRGNKALLDSDVAKIYGVETKRVNEAVKNNLDKFPQDYLFELDQDEKNELVENFDRFRRLKHSTTTPKAFTEKGLYMLATILKSKQATQATFTIIEAWPLHHAVAAQRAGGPPLNVYHSTISAPLSVIPTVPPSRLPTFYIFHKV